MKKLLAASVLALAAQGALADEIRVLNWQGYGTDLDWSLEAFTEATGHTVVHEYFTSEQEMLTKLRTNPGAYDVVLVNAAYTAQAQEEGLIGPVDAALISNFADLDPNLTGNEDLNPGGALHGVPWTWGLTSLAVNAGEFPDAPTSLSVLWDPELKGRVSIRDDGLEAVQFAAMATGQNINDIQDMDAVKAKLTELLPQITTFWGSENDWNQFMAAGDFAVATYWSGSASRSISKGLPITFVVADEGAIGWLDGLSIPASSTHKEAAHAFIDWMVDPEFYVKWDAEGAPATSNAKAAAALPETSFNRTVLGDPATVAKVQFMRPVSEENRETYLKLWQELKAAQ
ncbi:spermidine/putrescine ABC transporter substrate-binding protein [Leisingera sp. ANG-M1]|uniref:ABC transporter substrate-binding protein n=1 Tax=Leisingera sp. ANG-M1 TaxID=1577895 RepID=UPI00057C501B|nr:extracellular solute-binding protein [Leisingera sp. ANG-M1]KIC08772.1 spermidine/putrescine ABC transporter substrate-binding protein [Leisingera sp. ANG-M1]